LGRRGQIDRCHATLISKVRCGFTEPIHKLTKAIGITAYLATADAPNNEKLRYTLLQRH
jgi:hypothetical protein